MPSAVNVPVGPFVRAISGGVAGEGVLVFHDAEEIHDVAKTAF